MEKGFLSFMATVALSGVMFTGCGGSGSGSDAGSDTSGIADSFLSSGNKGSGNKDTLTIVKTEGDNFKLTWVKKSSGYSEVVYDRHTDGKRNRGEWILTGNAPVTHVLDCVVDRANSNLISYECQNENQNTAVILRSWRPTFDTQAKYDFWINNGTYSNRVKQPVAYTLEYDGSTQSLSITRK
jgi:hypothetical protein